MNHDVARQQFPFSLPSLPYAYDALEPHVDEKTLTLHHRAHHKSYVTKLNDALADQRDLHTPTLEDLLRDPGQLPERVRTAVVNNGGGHLLHFFYWLSMTPSPAREPGGDLAQALAKDFGSVAGFREAFSDAAAKHFASGWVALIADNASRELAIEHLKDHAVPDLRTKTTLLILDVWEHAYYVKYQNRRPEFIEAFWNVVNWAFAEERFTGIGGTR